ncbi:hypothetical protein IMW75_03300 [Pseudomonas gregormendelii]|uniref:Uncharacterized protein n=1 Tax=Pseudomonas gregormendelii TaxID=1628277 RepID=A0ABS3ABB0_9PSED|nr:hypothetical protein [Pseudomonas gregormendelii]MBN3964311.1 hypothetical protein [Pseudomonas gregormendelii]
MTNKIDPSTLSGTELLLRQTHCPDTLATSSPEAITEAVTKEALPEDEEAPEEAVIAFKAALELLAARERATQLVALAKQAQKNKGK